MIESKKNVPRIFRQSRDFKALLKLLDIVTCVNKSDNDNLVSLINPDRCPDIYLPLLATYVGYNYDYTLPYDTNRNIIKYYPELIRLRGSEAGIKLAVAVAINSSDSRYGIQSSSNLVTINYDKSTDILTIYVYFSNYLRKLDDLIQVVKPVGLNCRIVDSSAVRENDKIEISDDVSYQSFFYSDISFRHLITNNFYTTGENSCSVSVSIPLATGEQIVADSVSLTVPVFFKCKVNYTSESGLEVLEYEDNILKNLYIEDDSSGVLGGSGNLTSDSLVLNIGLPGQIKQNAFVDLFDLTKEHSINYSTGELKFSLKTFDTPSPDPDFDLKRVSQIYSINDAVVTYTVSGGSNPGVRNSKLRDEIGFSQIKSET